MLESQLISDTRLEFLTVFSSDPEFGNHCIYKEDKVEIENDDDRLLRNQILFFFSPRNYQKNGKNEDEDEDEVIQSSINYTFKCIGLIQGILGLIHKNNDRNMDVGIDYNEIYSKDRCHFIISKMTKTILLEIELNLWLVIKIRVPILSITKKTIDYKSKNHHSATILRSIFGGNDHSIDINNNKNQNEFINDNNKNDDNDNNKESFYDKSNSLKGITYILDAISEDNVRKLLLESYSIYQILYNKIELYNKDKQLNLKDINLIKFNLKSFYIPFITSIDFINFDNICNNSILYPMKIYDTPKSLLSYCISLENQIKASFNDINNIIFLYKNNPIWISSNDLFNKKDNNNENTFNLLQPLFKLFSNKNLLYHPLLNFTNNSICLNDNNNQNDYDNKDDDEDNDIETIDNNNNDNNDNYNSLTELYSLNDMIKDNKLNQIKKTRFNKTIKDNQKYKLNKEFMKNIIINKYLKLNNNNINKSIVGYTIGGINHHDRLNQIKSIYINNNELILWSFKYKVDLELIFLLPKNNLTSNDEIYNIYYYQSLKEFLLLKLPILNNLLYNNNLYINYFEKYYNNHILIHNDLLDLLYIILQDYYINKYNNLNLDIKNVLNISLKDLCLKLDKNFLMIKANDFNYIKNYINILLFIINHIFKTIINDYLSPIIINKQNNELKLYHYDSINYNYLLNKINYSHLNLTNYVDFKINFNLNEIPLSISNLIDIFKYRFNLCLKSLDIFQFNSISTTNTTTTTYNNDNNFNNFNDNQMNNLYIDNIKNNSNLLKYFKFPVSQLTLENHLSNNKNNNNNNAYNNNNDEEKSKYFEKIDISLDLQRKKGILILMDIFKCNNNQKKKVNNHTLNMIKKLNTQIYENRKLEQMEYNFIQLNDFNNNLLFKNNVNYILNKRLLNYNQWNIRIIHNIQYNLSLILSNDIQYDLYSNGMNKNKNKNNSNNIILDLLNVNNENLNNIKNLLNHHYKHNHKHNLHFNQQTIQSIKELLIHNNNNNNNNNTVINNSTNNKNEIVLDNQDKKQQYLCICEVLLITSFLNPHFKTHLSLLDIESFFSSLHSI